MKQIKKLTSIAVVTAAIPALPFLLLNTYTIQIINMIGTRAIVGSGVNVLTGYTGQLSLGQAAFYGIGACTTVLLNTKLGCPFFVVLPVSVLVTAVFRVVLAIPALKVRGGYPALLTIDFSGIVRVALANWIDLVNGPTGVVGVKASDLLGFEFDALFRYYYLIASFAFIGIMYQKWLMKSRTGRAFTATRDDDKIAKLTGTNIAAFKIRAFVLSAVYPAVTDMLCAMMIHYISSNSFTNSDSNTFLWTVIMGGMGAAIRPMIGTVIVNILPEALRLLRDWHMVVYGVILLTVTICYPGGITPYAKKLIGYVQAKFDGKGG